MERKQHSFIQTRKIHGIHDEGNDLATSLIVPEFSDDYLRS